MRIVVVKFDSTSREYEYQTNLNLIVGGQYNITADGDYIYGTPVTILCYRRNPSYKGKLRTITNATCVKAPARPDDNVEKVIFNEKKRTTVVIWKDGIKTAVKCNPQDTWSKETGLAMCYMKRMHQNRGAYNETLKKWCKDD